MSGEEHEELLLNERFLEHLQFPKNIGFVGSPTGLAKGVGSCGDSVEVTILVEDGRLSQVRAFPEGCAYTIACASAMTQMAQGRSVDEALELTPEELDRLLGGLPDDHMHCARLAINTLGEAIEDHFRRVKLEIPAGEGTGA